MNDTDDVINHPKQWKKPHKVATSHKRGTLQATVTVDFTAEETNIIRDMAKRLHLPYTAVVRKAVREMAQPTLNVWAPLSPVPPSDRTETRTPSDPHPVKRLSGIAPPQSETVTAALDGESLARR